MNYLKKVFFDLFPQIIFSSTIIFALLSYFFVSDSYFLEMVKNYKIFNSFGLILIFIYLFIFSLPFLLRLPTPIIEIRVQQQTILRYALLSFFLALIGNILFFRFFYQNPDQIFAWTSSLSVGGLRTSLNETQIPGITTMTQFAVPSVVLFMILFLKFNFKKSILFFVYILLFFALARSFYYSERLAIIELVIPIFVLLSFFNKISVKKVFILGIIFLTLIWSFEYFRSYSNYWYADNYSATFFIINRFFMYFATTINNFFVATAYFEFQNYMIDILAPFYQFSENYSIEGYNNYYKYASPEFNSPFYFGVIYTNFWLFSPFIIFIISSFVKISFFNFRLSNFFGLYFFPIIFLSILDIRIMYLFETRIFFFYFVFFLIVMEVILRKKMRTVYDN